jgi:hypothetical protein
VGGNDPEEDTGEGGAVEGGAVEGEGGAVECRDGDESGESGSANVMCRSRLVLRGCRRRRGLRTGLSGYRIAMAEAALSVSRTLEEDLLCRECEAAEDSAAGGSEIDGSSGRSTATATSSTAVALPLPLPLLFTCVSDTSRNTVESCADPNIMNDVPSSGYMVSRAPSPGTVVF